ncbi:DUF1508 domain-containing protein [Stenotrophomonas maltophilia]|uniref:YegP family protein n=1 Tax=Stenotrophomonas maltophilia TaxID=40324 RepID=UPI002097EEF1|nr:DUF1508 domain-containing protein [Stenotrophomonas maltophilia]MCO7398307.1 DUF1508 domain-containing protein [Stenotrophomonas maltophilia]MCO7411509.1 DUF1508 domain-containing protein [Stenotrophomonas maltophilia]
MAAIAKQFVIYKDTANEFRWRLYAQNGRVVADSGEGYKNRADCVHGARLVASVATGALIWDADNEVWID